MIAGPISPDSGSVTLGASLKMGYFAQQSLDLLDPDLKVEEQLQRHFPHESIGALRNLAGAFHISGIARGHMAVVFLGRHVAAFTDPASHELADFWSDVQDLARAIERVFQPCHLNFMLLGNLAPHLHVHVVPRYLDDPAPERPLPWTTSKVPEDLFAEQCRQLKDAMPGTGKR